ncbi:MAG TPA: SPOR domain-containing protein [Rhodocyclaceae bacterium]|nr:SPOR domain-containing protein [Rhodocyclaceae bacterium]
MEDTDAQLHLKKRARRRLVGAVAFVVLVAVALPMIMDHEPKQVVQDVEIRIPGQDEKPFAPKFAAAPVDRPVAKPADPVETPKPAEKPAETVSAPVPLPKADAAGKPAPAAKSEPTAKLVDKVPEKATDKTQDKPQDKPAPKSEKTPEKPVAKPAEKPAAKESPADAKRAAAILAGKGAEPATAPTAAKGGEHVILIGAFANESNVKTIKSKLGELGIRAYTEPLDSPQGRKTRVRAGPFPSREAADKALDRMKRIGVSGVVAAKQ